MDIYRLKIFLSAADTLSFTASADKMSLTQSAVSHNISSLENELRVKLFERSHNRLILTHYGQVFYRDAKKIVEAADQAAARSSAMHSGEKGSLLIGFPFTQLVDQFLPQFDAFRQAYPEVNTVYSQIDSITLSRKLDACDVDIAFGRRDAFPENNAIQWRHLYKDDFYAIMNKNHPLTEKEEVTMEDLEKETILTMNRQSNPGMYKLIRYLFLHNGITPNINDTSNSHESTLLRAAFENNIVILPYEYIRYGLIERLTARRINASNASHVIGMAWNSNNKCPALPHFLDIFFESFERTANGNTEE